MKPICYLIIAATTALIFTTSSIAETIVHFDNLDVVGDTANGTFKPLPAPAPDYPQAMAQTFVATGENVNEVTLGFGRFGMPGGKLIFSIREVDSAMDEPGKELGVLGELILNNVPQDENDVCAQPKKLPTVTVNGFVDGLIPGETYFLHVIESLDDKPTLTNFGSGPCGVLESGYSIDLVPNGGERQIGEGSTHLLDWPYAPDGVLAGEWQPWPEPNRGHLSIRMRIAGTATQNPEPSDPFIIITTGDGSVIKLPDMKTYPIGSEVSVTAEAEEGFEFVKWLYGDEEYAENPANITIQEGLKLTPVFARSTSPLNVDIEAAVAICWDSQADKTYQIHLSTDMETWEIAVDGILGTGERLTQCFLREDPEIFYRVEVK